MSHSTSSATGLVCPGSPGSLQQIISMCCIPPAIQMSLKKRCKGGRACSRGWWIPIFVGWHSCNDCGWLGYFGPEPTTDWYRLKYHDWGKYHYLLLCSWCEADYLWREDQRDHFIECCKFTGFGPDDWFPCTVCGRWGYFGGEEVPEHYLLYWSCAWIFRFELLCQRCKR